MHEGAGQGPLPEGKKHHETAKTDEVQVLQVAFELAYIQMNKEYAHAN
jgi:hypothetical protein